MKVSCGWTDKSLTVLLELLKEAFSKEIELPNSYCKAKNITADLDFTYKTWDTGPILCCLEMNIKHLIDVNMLCI